MDADAEALDVRIEVYKRRDLSARFLKRVEIATASIRSRAMFLEVTTTPTSEGVVLTCSPCRCNSC
jgi:hypothetical protein